MDLLELVGEKVEPTYVGGMVDKAERRVTKRTQVFSTQARKAVAAMKVPTVYKVSGPLQPNLFFRGLFNMSQGGFISGNTKQKEMEREVQSTRGRPGTKMAFQSQGSNWRLS